MSTRMIEGKGKEYEYECKQCIYLTCVVFINCCLFDRTVVVCVVNCAPCLRFFSLL